MMRRAEGECGEEPARRRQKSRQTRMCGYLYPLTSVQRGPRSFKDSGPTLQRRVGGAQAGTQGRPSDSFINYWKMCFCVGSAQQSFTRVSRRRWRQLPGGAGTQGRSWRSSEEKPGSGAPKGHGFKHAGSESKCGWRSEAGAGEPGGNISPSNRAPSKHTSTSSTAPSSSITPAPPPSHPAPPATLHLPSPACSPAPSLMGPSPPQQRSIRSVGSLRTRLHPPDWLEPDRCWISSTRD